MTDIAELGFRVDTRGLVAGARALDDLDRAGRRAGTVGGTLDRSMRGAAGGIGATSGASAGLIGLLGRMKGVVGGIGFAAMAKGAFDTYRSFESMAASLKTVTGSSAAASAAFKNIEAFAKTTPYNLEQAVQGFIKLKSLGLDPSMAALNSYGNTASAMGKTLNDMIEAVADASVGEFERLKEFGIKAKTEGDNVTFTFQGVSTTVGKNAAEIEAYLRRIGDVQFAGAMSDQMNTLNGAISNVGDAFGGLQRAVVSQSGAGDLAKLALQGLASVIDATTAFVIRARLGFDAFREALDVSDAVPYVVLRTLGDVIRSVGTTLAPVIPYLGEFAVALAAIGGTVGAVRLAGIAISGIGAAVALVTSPVALFVAALAGVAVAVRHFDDVKAAATRFVSWWAGTEFDEKVMDVDSELLNAAYKAADALFTWWDRSALKKVTPQVVVDVIEKARAVGERFFNWWATTPFDERVLDIKYAAIKAAQGAAERFALWWRATTLGEKIASVDLGLLYAARDASRAFFDWWAKSTLKTLVPTVVVDAVERARKLAETFFLWWGSTSLAERELQIKTALLNAARNVAARFVSWWNGETLAEKIATVRTDLLEVATDAVQRLFDFWRGTTLVEKALIVATEFLESARSVAGGFFAWWDASRLKTMAPQVVLDAVETARAYIDRFFAWWDGTTLAEKALDIETAAIDGALALGSGFVRWWAGLRLGELVLAVGTTALDAALALGAGFVRWWQGLRLGELVLAVGTRALDAALALGSGFARWWQGLRLDEVALRVGTAALDAALALGSGFTRWWSGLRLGDLVLSVETAALDLATRAAAAFVSWWTRLDLRAVVLTVQTTALDAAERASDLFVRFWNTFTLTGKVLPITADPLESARQVAGDLIAWWRTATFERKVLDVATAPLGIARAVADAFIDSWNRSDIKRLILDVDTGPIAEARDALGVFARDVRVRWDEITSTVNDSSFVGTASGVWRELAGALSRIFGDIVKGARAVLPDIGRAFSVAFGDTGRLIGEFVQTAGKLIGDFVQRWRDLYPTLRTIAVAGWDNLIGVVNVAWVAIKNAVKIGWDLVTGILTVGLRLLRGDFAGAWDEVVGTAKQFGINFVAALNELGPALQEAGRKIVGHLADGIEAMGADVRDKFVAIFDFIPGIGDDVEKQTRPIGDQIPDTLATRISAGAPVVERAAKDVAARAVDGIGDSAAQAAEKAGENIGEGAERGLLSRVRNLFGAGEKSAEAAIDGIETAAEIKSPSRVTFASGAFMAEGLELGIESGGADVVAAARSIASDTALAFGGITAGLSSIYGSLDEMGLSARGFKREWDAVYAVLEGSTDRMKEAGLASKEARDEFNEQTDALYQQSFALTHTAEETRLFQLSMQQIRGEAADYVIMLERQNARLEQLAEIQSHVQGTLKDLAIEHAILVTGFRDGADAAELLKHRVEGYGVAEARLAVDLKRANEMLAVRRQVFDNLQSGVENALTNASSITDAFGKMGTFLRDWLKGMIAEFAAKKIMVYLGIGGGAGGGITQLESLLGGLGGLLGGAKPATGAGGLAVGGGATSALNVAPAAGALSGLTSAIGAIPGPAMVAVGAVAALTLAFSSSGRSLSERLREDIRNNREVKAAARESITGMFVELRTNLISLGGSMAGGVVGAWNDWLNLAVANIGINTKPEQYAAIVGNAIRGGVQAAYDEQSPEMQRIWNRYLDIANGTSEELLGGFTQMAEDAVAVMPLLTLAGADINRSLDEAAIGALNLVDAMGSVEAATSALNYVLGRFFTESEITAVRVDTAREQIAGFNAELGLSGAAAIDTADEWRAAWAMARQDTSEYGAARQAVLLDLGVSLGVVLDAENERRTAMMASVGAAIAANEAERARAAETAANTETLGVLMRNLGLAFDTAAPGTQRFTATLVELMGGIDNVTSATGNYYQLFYSETERTQMSLAQSAAAVQAFNNSLDPAALALAGITDGVIDSAPEFRAYVESLDLTTAAGARAYAAAMDVTDSMYAVSEAGDGVSGVVGRLPETLRTGFDGMVSVAEQGMRPIVQTVADTGVAFGNLGRTIGDTMNGASVGVVKNMDGIKGAFDFGGQNIVGAMQRHMESAANAADVGGKGVLSAIQRHLEGAVTFADAGGKSIVAAVQRHFEASATVADQGGKGMVSAVRRNFEASLAATDQGGKAMTAQVEAMRRETTLAAERAMNNIQASVKGGMDNAANDTSAGLVRIVGSHRDGIKGVEDTTRAGLVRVLGVHRDGVKGVEDATRAGLVRVLDAHRGGIKSVEDTTRTGFVRVLGAHRDGIKGAEDATRTGFVRVVGVHRDGMREIDGATGGGFVRVLGTYRGGMGSLESATQQGMGGVNDKFRKVLENINGTARDGFKSLGDTITGSFGGLGARIQGSLNSIKAPTIKIPSVKIPNITIPTSKFSVNGSHAAGLDSVPFNGYIAELHRGEMVVPADAAGILRALDSTEWPGQVAANMPSAGAPPVAGADAPSGAMLAELRALRAEIAALRRERAEASRRTDGALGAVVGRTEEQTVEIRKVVRANDQLSRKIA